ncbi:MULTISPECIES: hypothetical protein [Streptomyces]|uniref:Uncharacterized protein n=1 Tax=Streptomyces amritsarensis TaxID=681158 RepID=A0ABX3G567_9ACTN|nr:MULTISPECIES: hypothetical protein [Streptomyces]AQT70701.1 hypothetical protein B1K54_02220 [Streptomyces sp. fd1-xmd]MDX6759700.1 hypothetical protein [Streptomyces sp. F8]OLZ69582.1 hypothetical protein AVW11_09840 [Streptomyces amritsarensis]
MADDPGTTLAATLCDAPDFGGTTVTVLPDGGHAGGELRAYALAWLGLRRLGSLRAPFVPADPDSPFRQELRRGVNVTVWNHRPATWTLPDDQRGRTWQTYGADTADLGDWAAKATYVRVWEEAAGSPSHTVVPAPDGAEPGRPVLVVE